MKTMTMLTVARATALLVATATSTGCYDYCDGEQEATVQSVMVMRQKLVVDRAGKHSETSTEESTYGWTDEGELRIRDASKATGIARLQLDNVRLLLPMPLEKGTYPIEGPPSEEELGGCWASSCTLTSVRGGYWENTETDLPYVTATGSVEVESVKPLSFTFTLSGTDAWGEQVEVSGSVDSYSDEIEDPDFYCND